MAYKPTRRRGPNKVKPEPIVLADVLATPPAAEAPTDEPAPTVRRRRASVSGLQLKLGVPEKKGFQRRWFNDVGDRLATAHNLAYDHVTDQSIKSDGTDSRIRRRVGTQADGSPQYAYLMETPLEEYQRGVDEKEEQHRATDEAIRAGRDATGRVQDAYGEGSIGTR